jgi:hypothetical protein
MQRLRESLLANYRAVAGNPAGDSRLSAAAGDHIPSVERAAGLVEHSRHARFVWNCAVEQRQTD